MLYYFIFNAGHTLDADKRLEKSAFLAEKQKPLYHFVRPQRVIRQGRWYVMYVLPLDLQPPMSI